MGSIETLKTEWLPMILSGQNVGKYVLEHIRPGDFVAKDTPATNVDKHVYRLSIYTSRHKYAIKAVEEENGMGYLGCIAQVRKPRAGEDWHRGSDLPDGPLSKETWNNILRAIVRYELVPLEVSVEQMPEVFESVRE